MTGKCRLCLGEGALVDSHIIPKFYYKPLKEEEGHYKIVSSDPAKRDLKGQKGITEHLLCPNCDNERLQRNEKHLSGVIFGGHSLGANVDGRLLTFSGYEFKRVKNGLLSILWRMSVSSRPYFAEVSLGPKHGEIIRLALLNDTELAEDQYPILVTAPAFEGQLLGNWMLPPEMARVGMNRVYRCLISGLLFTFFIGSAGWDDIYSPLLLRRDRWPIVRAKVEEIPFLLEACRQIGVASACRG
jgi:hypothetical protein